MDMGEMTTVTSLSSYIAASRPALLTTGMVLMRAGLSADASIPRSIHYSPGAVGANSMAVTFRILIFVPVLWGVPPGRSRRLLLSRSLMSRSLNETPDTTSV
jgi:hypothetical protein